MPSVSLTTIRERVRQICDLPPFTSSSSVTDAAVLDFIRTAVALLAGIVKERSGELYFVQSTDIATANGVATLPLPTNFDHLIRIAWIKSAQEEIQLELASSDEFEAYPNRWGAVRPRYRLVGQNIELYPTPDAVYTIRVYHSTGLYPTLVSDSIVCRDGWDQWVTLQTAVLVRSRQQKDASDIAIMLGKCEQDVRAELKRDRFGLRQIRDHRGLYAHAARSLRTGRWY